jgi:hypothetical protein
MILNQLSPKTGVRGFFTRLTLVWGRETTLLDHLILVLDEELDSLDGGGGSLGDSGGDTTLFEKKKEEKKDVKC